MPIPVSTKWFDLVSEPANKMTFLTFRSNYTAEIKQLKTSNNRQFIPSTSLLDENTATIPFYLAMTLHNPYTPQLKVKVEDMIANGLIEKWYNEMRSIKRDEKTFVEDVEPEVLSVNDLKLGFFAVLITAVVSVCVFLIELMLKALKIPESFTLLKISVPSRKPKRSRKKSRKKLTKRIKQARVVLVQPK
jgi:hypothetical protein